MFMIRKLKSCCSWESLMSQMRAENMMDFFIPDHILIPGSEASSGSESGPECPVIVFINTKSGGQLGGELLVTYQSLLNKNQVMKTQKKETIYLVTLNL